MSEIKINIDGRELLGNQGQTVLQIARENGIEIPSLCNDERVKMYGSCGVCVVEREGSPKLLRSCSTVAANGMVIATNTDRVRKVRQSALELMLSDHTGDCRPPCVLACPGQTDCQGYVGLLALGEYEEALKLVKDKIPLPGSIGRVCPHPCETACRRELVEEPISIAALKSYLGDKDMENPELLMPTVGEPTGKKVGIIGGGPGGLTAAYFLRQQGHEVDIYDMMPQMGGMLYYGIPEYRLPKDYLLKEANSIRDMGVGFKNNIRIGKDLSLDWVRENYDAVVVAVGAWISTDLRCKGEDLDGVVGGIDFLREVALGNTQLTGKNVAIVGGGNTAMDACRTAVRLGAKKVYNIYRRTRNEMPAEDIEIVEAEEEGVIFKHLTNPIEVVGKNGKASSIRIQIMELGEPDASGRRAPVAVEGKEEVLEIDTVIVAIGQKLDINGLEEISTTDWKTIAADEATFRTNLEGVFAIGDATNNGADIAIAAIGEAKKAAASIDGFLNGEEVAYKAPYLVKKTVTANDLADRPKLARSKMPHRTPEDRKHTFLEVNHGLTDEQAKLEAHRCLECGCHDYFECQLINYANQYDVNPAKFEGEKHNREKQVDNSHPYIMRNPDKCILCGLCVRICDEVVGSTALGLVNRGFNTMVSPALELPLNETSCVSCGQCVAVCPTGALMEKLQINKQVVMNEESTVTTCSFCSVGCKQKLTHKGNLLVRALPYNEDPKEALLCLSGRIGFGEISTNKRLTTPLIKNDKGEFVESDLKNATILISKKMQSLQTVYGKDSVAVSVSDRYTIEEATLIRDYANKALGIDNVFSYNAVESGLKDVLGADCSTANFDELKLTDYILLVNTNPKAPHLIAGLTMKKAVESGAKLIALNGFESTADEFATRTVNPGENLELLVEVLKAILEASPKAKDLENYDKLLKTLTEVKVSEAAAEIAKEYTEARKAIIVFDQSSSSPDAARIIGNIAVAAGHQTAPRSGVIQLKAGANAQGLAVLGIESPKPELLKSLKGLIVFGEDIKELGTPDLEFLAVHDLYLTDTASKANAVIPAKSFAEVNGSFVNTVGNIGNVEKAIEGPVAFDTYDIITSLTNVLDKKMLHINRDAVAKSWKKEYANYNVGAGNLVDISTKSLVTKHIETNALVNSLNAMAVKNNL